MKNNLKTLKLVFFSSLIALPLVTALSLLVTKRNFSFIKAKETIKRLNSVSLAFIIKQEALLESFHKIEDFSRPRITYQLVSNPQFLAPLTLADLTVTITSFQKSAEAIKVFYRLSYQEFSSELKSYLIRAFTKQKQEVKTSDALSKEAQDFDSKKKQATKETKDHSQINTSDQKTSNQTKLDQQNLKKKINSHNELNNTEISQKPNSESALHTNSNTSETNKTNSNQTSDNNKTNTSQITELNLNQKKYPNKTINAINSNSNLSQTSTNNEAVSKINNTINDIVTNSNSSETNESISSPNSLNTNTNSSENTESNNAANNYEISNINKTTNSLDTSTNSSENTESKSAANNVGISNINKTTNSIDTSTNTSETSDPTKTNTNPNNEAYSSENNESNSSPNSIDTNSNFNKTTESNSAANNDQISNINKTTNSLNNHTNASETTAANSTINKGAITDSNSSKNSFNTISNASASSAITNTNISPTDASASSATNTSLTNETNSFETTNTINSNLADNDFSSLSITKEALNKYRLTFEILENKKILQNFDTIAKWDNNSDLRVSWTNSSFEQNLSFKDLSYEITNLTFTESKKENSSLVSSLNLNKETSFESETLSKPSNQNLTFKDISITYLIKKAGISSDLQSLQIKGFEDRQATYQLLNQYRAIFRIEPSLNTSFKVITDFDTIDKIQDHEYILITYQLEKALALKENKAEALNASELDLASASLNSQAITESLDAFAFEMESPAAEEDQAAEEEAAPAAKEEQENTLAEEQGTAENQEVDAEAAPAAEENPEVEFQAAQAEQTSEEEESEEEETETQALTENQTPASQAFSETLLARQKESFEKQLKTTFLELRADYQKKALKVKYQLAFNHLKSHIKEAQIKGFATEEDALQAQLNSAQLLVHFKAQALLKDHDSLAKVKASKALKISLDPQSLNQQTQNATIEITKVVASANYSSDPKELSIDLSYQLKLVNQLREIISETKTLTINGFDNEATLKKAQLENSFLFWEIPASKRLFKKAHTLALWEQNINNNTHIKVIKNSQIASEIDYQVLKIEPERTLGEIKVTYKLITSHPLVLNQNLETTKTSIIDKWVDPSLGEDALKEFKKLKGHYYYLPYQFKSVLERLLFTWNANSTKNEATTERYKEALKIIFTNAKNNNVQASLILNTLAYAYNNTNFQGYRGQIKEISSQRPIYGEPIAAGFKYRTLDALGNYQEAFQEANASRGPEVINIWVIFY